MYYLTKFGRFRSNHVGVSRGPKKIWGAGPAPKFWGAEIRSLGMGAWWPQGTRCWTMCVTVPVWLL